MENKSNAFIELFNSSFSENKIKTDFKSYLNECFGNQKSSYSIKVYNETKEISTNVVISLEDAITVISYRCIVYFKQDIEFIVKIAVGHYIENSTNMHLFQVEKCLASLIYNVDLEIIDVEFTIDEINQIE